MEVSNKELNIALKESGFEINIIAENIKNWIVIDNMESKGSLNFYLMQIKALFETK